MNFNKQINMINSNFIKNPYNVNNTINNKSRIYGLDGIYSLMTLPHEMMCEINKFMSNNDKSNCASIVALEMDDTHLRYVISNALRNKNTTLITKIIKNSFDPNIYYIQDSEIFMNILENDNYNIRTFITCLNDTHLFSLNGKKIMRFLIENGRFLEIRLIYHLIINNYFDKYNFDEKKNFIDFDHTDRAIRLGKIKIFEFLIRNGATFSLSSVNDAKRFGISIHKILTWCDMIHNQYVKPIFKIVYSDQIKKNYGEIIKKYNDKNIDQISFKALELLIIYGFIQKPNELNHICMNFNKMYRKHISELIRYGL